MKNELLEEEFRRLEREIAWLDGVLTYAVGEKSVDELTTTEAQVIFNLTRTMSELKEEFANVIDQIQRAGKG